MIGSIGGGVQASNVSNNPALPRLTAKLMDIAFGSQAVVSMRDERIQQVKGYALDGNESPWNDQASLLGTDWKEGARTRDGARQLQIGPNDQGAYQKLLIQERDKSMTLVSHTGNPATHSTWITLRNGQTTQCVRPDGNAD